MGVADRSVNDGGLPVDRNLTKREMKRHAPSRKASLLVGIERSGRTAAVLSCITSNCRRHGIAPPYLMQLLANLPATPVSTLDEWMPDQWRQRQTPPSA